MNCGFESVASSVVDAISFQNRSCIDVWEIYLFHWRIKIVEEVEVALEEEEEAEEAEEEGLE